MSSAFDNTKSQTHNDRMLKAKLNQTRGTVINLIINLNTLKIFGGTDAFREFIADFKKSWFMVSQRLVIKIKNKTGINPCFMKWLSPVPCWIKKQISLR